MANTAQRFGLIALAIAKMVSRTVFKKEHPYYMHMPLCLICWPISFLGLPRSESHKLDRNLELDFFN